jgi:hypothetical protein
MHSGRNRTVRSDLQPTTAIKNGKRPDPGVSPDPDISKHKAGIVDARSFAKVKVPRLLPPVREQFVQREDTIELQSDLIPPFVKNGAEEFLN